MIVFPNAKINIGLHILGKREDGFHDIETIMYPIGWKDSLEILEANETSFHFHGLPIPIGGINSCESAYRLLRKEHDLPPLEVHLTKGIPTGAGLGGGSADAAFMLKAINEHFNLEIPSIQLESHAGQIGSDCAFFIQNKTATSSGKGEILTSNTLDLSGLKIVVVYPGVHISTAVAYQSANHSGPLASDPIKRDNIADWADLINNDFEVFAFSEHPEIKQVKDEMIEEGALYSSMSGSGSAVFGIFNDWPALTWPDRYLVWTEQL